MNVTAAAVVWLGVGLLLANWCFLTERRFCFVDRSVKPFWFRLIELLVSYLLLLVLGVWLESSMGAIQTQTWNFYAITFLLFLVMAYPGYVWRYLRRRSSGAS